MDKKNPNHCIACSVVQCANHCKTEDYCALERIKVGTHEKNPTVIQCTDCQSFTLGSDEHCCR